MEELNGALSSSCKTSDTASGEKYSRESMEVGASGNELVGQAVSGHSHQAGTRQFKVRQSAVDWRMEVGPE